MLKMVFFPEEHDEFGKGVIGPAFFCDACGEMITDGEQGIFAYFHQHGQVAPDTGEVFFFHTGTCYRRFEVAQDQDGKAFGWHMLWRFPLFLYNGLVPMEERISLSPKPGKPVKSS